MDCFVSSSIKLAGALYIFVQLNLLCYYLLHTPQAHDFILFGPTKNDDQILFLAKKEVRSQEFKEKASEVIKIYELLL